MGIAAGPTGVQEKRDLSDYQGEDSHLTSGENGADKVGGSCQVDDKAETNDCISPSGLLVSLSFLWLTHILTIWRVMTISCQERIWNDEKRII